MLFLVPVCYSVMTSSCQLHLNRLTATAARTQLVLHIFPPYFCQWCRWLCYRMLLFLCDHRLHNMLLMIMSSVIGAHSQYTLLLSVYLLHYSLVAICTSQLSAYSTLWPALRPSSSSNSSLTSMYTNSSASILLTLIVHLIFAFLSTFS